MSTIERVYDWLQIAFTEPFGRINEVFYYDKKANEFFSIFLTDHFLTDPVSASELQNIPYSEEEMAVLVRRMGRIEAKDPSILAVPQLTNEERQVMMQAFLNKEGLRHNSTLQSYVDGFQNRTMMQRFIDDKNGTELAFGGQLSEDYKGKWQSFKRLFVQSHIESFCNIHHINLETVTLFTDKKATSMIIDLKDTTSSEKIIPPVTEGSSSKMKSAFSLLKLFKRK